MSKNKNNNNNNKIKESKNSEERDASKDSRSNRLRNYIQQRRLELNNTKKEMLKPFKNNMGIEIDYVEITQGHLPESFNSLNVAGNVTTKSADLNKESKKAADYNKFKKENYEMLSQTLKKPEDYENIENFRNAINFFPYNDKEVIYNVKNSLLKQRKEDYKTLKNLNAILKESAHESFEQHVDDKLNLNNQQDKKEVKGKIVKNGDVYEKLSNYSNINKKEEENLNFNKIVEAVRQNKDSLVDSINFNSNNNIFEIKSDKLEEKNLSKNVDSEIDKKLIHSIQNKKDALIEKKHQEYNEMKKRRFSLKNDVSSEAAKLPKTLINNKDLISNINKAASKSIDNKKKEYQNFKKNNLKALKNISEENLKPKINAQGVISSSSFNKDNSNDINDNLKAKNEKQQSKEEEEETFKERENEKLNLKKILSDDIIVEDLNPKADISAEKKELKASSNNISNKYKNKENKVTLEKNENMPRRSLINNNNNNNNLKKSKDVKIKEDKENFTPNLSNNNNSNKNTNIKANNNDHKKIFYNPPSNFFAKNNCNLKF